ncbi:MAG: hypothetical protein RMJ34_05920, partial [candidate division WOR-3 bacterium]|nr:hypothetical protein [candidate division WOR-3 bacterium]
IFTQIPFAVKVFLLYYIVKVFKKELRIDCCDLISNLPIKFVDIFFALRLAKEFLNILSGMFSKVLGSVFKRLKEKEGGNKVIRRNPEIKRSNDFY